MLNARLSFIIDVAAILFRRTTAIHRTTNQDFDIEYYGYDELGLSQDEAYWGVLYDGDVYQCFDMIYYNYAVQGEVS